MRKLLITGILSVLWTVPALAQVAQAPAAPPADQGDATNAPDANAPHETPTTETAEQQLQSYLAAAGFTDIEVAPPSFAVRAKDGNGKSVLLMVSPDGIRALDDTPSDTDGKAPMALPGQEPM